ASAPTIAGVSVTSEENRSTGYPVRFLQFSRRKWTIWLRTISRRNGGFRSLHPPYNLPQLNPALLCCQATVARFWFFTPPKQTGLPRSRGRRAESTAAAPGAVPSARAFLREVHLVVGVKSWRRRAVQQTCCCRKLAPRKVTWLWPGWLPLGRP